MALWRRHSLIGISMPANTFYDDIFRDFFSINLGELIISALSADLYVLQLV